MVKIMQYAGLAYLFLFAGCNNYYEVEESNGAYNCTNGNCRKVKKDESKKRWYVGIGGCSCMPEEERKRFEEQLKLTDEQAKMLEPRMQKMEEAMRQQEEIMNRQSDKRLDSRHKSIKEDLSPKGDLF